MSVAADVPPHIWATNNITTTTASNATHVAAQDTNVVYKVADSHQTIAQQSILQDNIHKRDFQEHELTRKK